MRVILFSILVGNILSGRLDAQSTGNPPARMMPSNPQVANPQVANPQAFAGQATATPKPDGNAIRDAGEPIVELNLAGAVSLPKLVEAVAQQMDVRFLYSANLAGRQVTVYTPTRLPKIALPVLLGSLLKGENLAIVDSEVPGWKRIVDIKEMASHARPGEATEVLDRDGPAAAVTQVIPVRHAELTMLSAALTPFLSSGSNFITLAKNNLIIITDYAPNVQRVVELMKLIDQPAMQGVIEFYETMRRTPQSLIDQVQNLMGQNGAAAEAVNAAPGSAANFRLYDDASGKRVIVAGSKEKVAEIMLLLKRLDSGFEFQTKLYRLQNVSASRIDSLLDRLVATADKDQPSEIETSIDEEGNFLIVRAAPEVHRQVQKLIEQLDEPVDADASPIRFYKLKNADAGEVLLSLLSLQQVVSGQGGFGGGLGGFGSLGGLNVGGVVPALGVNQGFLGAGGLGAGGFGVGGFGMMQTSGVNPAMSNQGFGNTGNNSIGMPFNNGNAGELRSSVGDNANQGLGAGLGMGGFGGGLGLGGGGGVASLPGGARVSADVATNSLIVFAPSNVQPMYEKLIQSLDQRRPQVMIEAEIVAVDTSNNFRLGVEISGGDREGSKRLFQFTSFGLSEVNPTTGALAVRPALGFNGVVVDPEVADVIVQALSSHTRSRVLASPQVLVNDNETGFLESVNSVPFQSINTINTISTQSLGGEQQAGTKVTVTPQINENDFLQLEFEVEFSTFSESGGSATLPPPRQIDRVGSVVTIPDGQTVIVGGLKRVGEEDSFSGLPILERIPVLRELTSLQRNQGTTTSFFLFLRPRILRDSRFRDLQYLSEVETNLARIPADYPDSQPILIPCVQPPPSQPARHPSFPHQSMATENYPTDSYPTDSYPTETYPNQTILDAPMSHPTISNPIISYPSSTDR
jgi:general secretion pathway protein D